MNRTTIVASVVAIVGLCAAAYEYRVVQHVEAERAALRVERDGVVEKLRLAREQAIEAEQRAVRASEQNAALKDDFDRLFSKNTKSAAAIATNTTGALRVPQTGFVSGRSFWMPFRSAPAPALETTYHVLYRQLNLTPEQIAQFKAASTEAANRFEELDQQAKDRRVRPTDPTMQPLYLETEAKLKAKFTEHFGADALPVIQHFADTLFLREAVMPVASELFYTPTPLTEPQANQLVEIMWKNMRDPFGHTDPLFSDVAAMKAEAQQILSAPQLAVWHPFIDHMAKTSFGGLRPPPRIRR
jgi:hypothetical protein